MLVMRPHGYTEPLQQHTRSSIHLIQQVQLPIQHDLEIEIMYFKDCEKAHRLTSNGTTYW